MDPYATGSKANFYKQRKAGNTVGYVDFILSYAPCVTGKHYWENISYMQRVVEKNAPLEEFFTPTDEGFILVVIHNYRTRWLEEFRLDALSNKENKRKVRTHDICSCFRPTLLKYFSENFLLLLE